GDLAATGLHGEGIAVGAAGAIVLLLIGGGLLLWRRRRGQGDTRA
ncbi:LPXTG cell wall anchor domain-containing protein, partial [Acinetobacter baumannii]